METRKRWVNISGEPVKMEQWKPRAESSRGPTCSPGSVSLSRTTKWEVLEPDETRVVPPGRTSATLAKPRQRTSVPGEQTCSNTPLTCGPLIFAEPQFPHLERNGSLSAQRPSGCAGQIRWQCVQGQAETQTTINT